MASEIYLTDGTVRVTGALTQPMDQAVDVSDWDEMELLLGIVGVEGTALDIDIRVLTGMSKDNPDGWVVLGTFTQNLSAPNTWDKANFKGLLKYVRWDVTGIGGSGSPAATFSISGMVRRF